MTCDPMWKRDCYRENVYCPQCGQGVGPQTQGGLAVETEEDYRAYLGPRAENIC